MQEIKKAVIIVVSLLALFGCQTSIHKIVSLENASFIIYTFDEYGAATSTGSGFFIEPTGVGLTCYHVLDHNAGALIKTSDGHFYSISKILAADQQRDLIKFQVNADSKQIFEVLKIAEDEPSQGDKVFCISSPLRLFENTLSDGIVSALRRDSTITFTAPISKGSSGAPILNESGEVIALAKGIWPEGQNLNFGIKVNSEIVNGMISDDFTKNNEKFANPNKFVLLNEKASNDPFSVLNAIELGENETTLFFSYTRLIISPRDSSPFSFYFQHCDCDSGFTVFDLDNTNVNYHIKSSEGVGTDKEHALQALVGKTVRYKVLLPKFSSSTKHIAIYERNDSQGSTWNSISLESESSYNKWIANYDISIALGSMAKGDVNESQELFKVIIQLDPQNVLALNALGVLAYNKANYDDALEYFTKAKDASPSVEEAYVNRFFVYLAKEDYSNAELDINKAIAISPQESTYITYRSMLYSLQNGTLGGNRKNSQRL